MVKKILGKFYIYFILLLMYLPILVLIFFSFQEIVTIRFDAISTPSFKLYVDLFDFSLRQTNEIWIAVLHTIEIALAAAGVSTIIGTLGAIGIFYSRKRVRNVLNSISNISIVNAEIVTALSLRILYSFLDVKLSFFTLLIGHVVLTIPFVVLNVMPKLQQMDANEYEAALDLGATPTKALYKVVLPEIFPGIISGFLLSVTLSLDDYIITAYTSDTTFDTLSTYVYKSMVKKSVPLQFRSLTTIIFVSILIGVVIYSIVHKRKDKKERFKLENSR
ncbi:MAG: ABC transporter permease [Erysipelotrichaceae bacterium]|nr:ABC transporter permease [Erysipelotrichaceae bacterium]